ncbi:MAG: hypothetical protein JWM81_1105 [Candidatus Saccharibacteria bacterium]|nr:hypothetical protein [Candidatus Saccharibacteria bacterium]
MPQGDAEYTISPPDQLDPASRLDHLRAYYLDIASCQETPRPATLAYIKRGGSIRLCLNEIVKLSEPEVAEQYLADDRAEYIQELTHRPLIPWRRKQWGHNARSIYVDGVVAKIESVIDADTPERALALRQMPSIVEDTSFSDETPPDAETIAANHLYVLVDTALREHSERRNLIDSYKHKGLIARIIGNRVVRMALAGSVIVSSLSPRLHFIPIESETVADEVEVGLTILSASVFGLDAPEEIRWRYLDLIHTRETKRLHETLAENKQLSDLALRLSYNATRYGVHENFVTGRAASDDKQENLRRFAALDKEFEHLNNDPGGKPYSGDQALGYAARILIERKAAFAVLVAPERSAEERRKAYLTLAREIVAEDVGRMEKGLRASSFRNGLLRIVSIVPALLFSSAYSAANDATARGRDVANVGNHHKRQQT